MPSDPRLRVVIRPAPHGVFWAATRWHRAVRRNDVKGYQPGCGAFVNKWPENRQPLIPRERVNQALLCQRRGCFDRHK